LRLVWLQRLFKAAGSLPRWALRGFRELKLNLKASKATLATCTALILISVTAFAIRVQPATYGVYLYEFDPYLQYRVTDYILKNGFPAFFSWHDSMSWYPYGRDMFRSVYPGLPLTGAVLYQLLTTLGIQISLWDFVCYFPPFMGIMTCLAVYFLGKDLGGKQVGLLSALFIAISPAHVSRTFLGWYDDETVGIFTLVLIFIFYLRSLEPEKPWLKSTAYAVASGLALGYLGASWGTQRYAFGLIALFTFTILLFKYSTRLTVSYGITMGLGLYITALVPMEGLGFISELTAMASLGILVLLLFREFLGVFETRRAKALSTIFFLTAISVLALTLWNVGLISGLPTKYQSVLEPIFRTQFPLIESVGEHRPSTWASFFNSLGVLVLLAPLFLFFALQKPTERTVFTAIYTLTSLYFAASFARLELLLGPAFSVAGSYTLVEILKPFIDIVRAKPLLLRRRARFEGRVSRELCVIFLVVIFIISVLPLAYLGIRTAQTPASILSSSVPVRAVFTDWMQALTWIRDNLPENAVVMAWWDYGYWITVLGNKTTLADNGTLNWQQIATIGRAFISTEEEALPIMKSRNVTHVAVFVDFRSHSQLSGQQGYGIYQAGGYGEENKFIWMVRIANGEFGGFNESDYIDENGYLTQKYQESLIGRLIPYDFGLYPTQTGGYIPYYTGPSYHTLDHLKLVFVSNSIAKGGTDGWWYGGVVIYEVDYP